MADVRPTFEKPMPRDAVQSLLVDVATGRMKADLVVRNGRWVNVHSGEIIPGTDIAVVAGRFAYCGPDASHAIGRDTMVVDAAGRLGWDAIPAVRDGRIHEIKSPLILQPGPAALTEGLDAIARYLG